jgi:hypothetical protein
MGLRERALLLRHRLEPVRRRLLNPEIEAYLRLMAATRRGRTLDVLVLADSTWLWIAAQDTDLRLVTQMFGDALPPDVSWHWIAGGGYHPGLFLAYVRALLDAGRPLPPVIVMSANVRMLQPYIRAQPEYRFDGAIASMGRAARSRTPWMVRPSVKTPNAEEQARYAATEISSAFDVPRTAGEYWQLIAATRGTPEADRERRRLVFNFFFGVPSDAATNERVQQLREVSRLITDAGSRLIAYADPVNVEGGSELLGPDFTEHVRREDRIVEEAVRSGSGGALTWLPWVDVLPAEASLHRHDATQHLAESGRRFMADGLADAVSAVLGR